MKYHPFCVIEAVFSSYSFYNPHMQQAGEWGTEDEISVEPRKGWLLYICSKTL